MTLATVQAQIIFKTSSDTWGYSPGVFVISNHEQKIRDMIEHLYNAAPIHAAPILEARLHPWCGQWNEAATRRPVCQADGRNRRLPDCRTLAAQGFENRRGYYCARPRVPAWCADAEGFGAQTALIGQREVIPIGERPEGFAVRGIYCDRRR
jgi:hypothetical protein